MTTIRMFLTPGGFAAALTCLVLTACGQPGSMDSGMMPMPDAGPMMGDGGPDQPDAYVPPDHDSGMPDVDAGTDGGGGCTTGCTTQPDLPPPMIYVDTAMIAGCMTSMDGAHPWATEGTTGCTAGVFRETGTSQWLLNFDCPGAIDEPYEGIYRLGSDGAWYAKWDQAATANHGVLHPDADCTHLSGEFYIMGEATPYRTQNYWQQ